MELKVELKKQLKEYALEVAFSVDNGIMGLMGPSGSGKSISLKCIAGLMNPDEGRIVLDDKVLFDSRSKICLPPQERRIGYLFPNAALFPNMNVRDNILCGIRAKGEERTKALQKFLHRFQLSELAERYPRQLSSGQKQRVAMARLMATEPEVILLDEPFTALDKELKLEMEQELLNLLKSYEGLTIVVSHDQEQVSRLCNYTRHISKGHFVKE